MVSMLVVLSTLTVQSRFNDPDMWWHLKLGQVMWITHSLPSTDPFSFTAHGQAIVPHEWLAQLSIFAAYAGLGLPGLMLWLCLVSALLLIAAYVLCALYSGNATVGFSVRPQLIGYLFLVLELILIHLGRTRSPRWFRALPFLFAVWVNVHGSFLLGLIVAVVFLGCSFLKFQQGTLVATPWSGHAQRMLALALLLSAAAIFVNPGSLRQVLYPLDTMLHQPINLAIVEEWKPLVLTSQRGVGLMITLLAVFLIVAIQRVELYAHELVLLLLGTWLAASHERMAIVFGILAAPILTRLLAHSWETYNPATDRPVPNALVIAAALLVVWLTFPSRASLDRQVAATSPVNAVRFLQTHSILGPMFNDYTYGGYLIWAMPQHPVFIDGRADVYEWAGVLGPYAQFATLQSDPRQLLDRYGIQICLLNPQSAAARMLVLLPGWKTIYSDNLAVILERTADLR
jgi:hypothetical protein